MPLHTNIGLGRENDSDRLMDDAEKGNKMSSLKCAVKEGTYKDHNLHPYARWHRGRELWSNIMDIGHSVHPRFDISAVVLVHV